MNFDLFDLDADPIRSGDLIRVELPDQPDRHVIVSDVEKTGTYSRTLHFIPDPTEDDQP